MKTKLLAIAVLTGSTHLVSFAAESAGASYLGAAYADPAAGKSLFAVE